MPPVSWTSFVLSSSLRLSWISSISCAVIAGAAAAIVAVEGGYPAGGTPWPSRPTAAPDSGVKGGYPAGGTIWGGYPAGGAIWGAYPAGGALDGGYPAGGALDGGYPAGGAIGGGNPAGGALEGGMAQLDAAKGRPCAPSWTMPAWSGLGVVPHASR